MKGVMLALCSVFFAYVQGANLPFAGQVNTLLSYAAANGNSAAKVAPNTPAIP